MGAGRGLFRAPTALKFLVIHATVFCKLRVKETPNLLISNIISSNQLVSLCFLSEFGVAIEYLNSVVND